jgi:putative endonuclease
MKILATNYRCPSGEVDLIALDPSARAANGLETIVFVEVKTRSGDRYTSPESAVGLDKQRRLHRAARYYLAHRDTQGYLTRFDIVAIVLPAGQEPKLTYIENAFA